MYEETYPSFPKIPRLAKDITITEKIDGTNGLIEISQNEFGFWLRAGSRNRWLTRGSGGDEHFQPGEGKLIDKDNYGFGRFVIDNAEELTLLGVGKHYGEWFGQGIQRGYGLSEKHFALFRPLNPEQVSCAVSVPVLYSGPFDGEEIERALNTLRKDGSRAVPGFMDPEGVIVRFHTNGVLYKAFCENED